MIYKKVKGPRGTVKYMSDEFGRLRFIAEHNITPSILAKLKTLEIGEIYTVGSEPAAQLKTEKICIFCGQPGDCSKFVHAQMVYLCNDDYQNKTTGEVGAKVKEMLYAQG